MPWGPKPTNIWGLPGAEQRRDVLDRHQHNPPDCPTHPVCPYHPEKLTAHETLPLPRPWAAVRPRSPNSVLLSFPRAPRRMPTSPTPPSSSPPTASRRGTPGGTVLPRTCPPRTGRARSEGEGLRGGSNGDRLYLEDQSKTSASSTVYCYRNLL